MSNYSEVVEIPLMERIFAARNLLVTLCIVVKGQLDVDILRDSFTKLLVQWPKLGGNLTRKDGKLKGWDVVVSIPSQPDINSIAFTTRSETTTLIPSLPKKTAFAGDPIYSTHMNYFKSDTRPDKCIEILDTPNSPTTFVHITTFLDATCIGITVPHLMYDAIALCEIVKEWSSIVGGSQIIRKTVHGDPLKEVTSVPYPKTKTELIKFHQDKYSTCRPFSRVEWYRFVSKFIADIIRHPKEKTKLIFIPMNHIGKIRKLAQDQGQWISENDVVTALLYKLSFNNRKKKTRSKLGLAFTGNLRSSIPTLSKDVDEVFLGNANHPMTVPAKRITELRKDSVESIAMSIRTSIEKQREYKEIEKICTVCVECAKRDEHIQYQPDKSLSYYITSWARGRMFEYDFSGAIKKIEGTADEKSNGKVEGSVEDEVKPGHVLHVDGTSGLMNIPKRGWCVIFGKANGQEAGYFAEFTAPLFAWPAVDKEIKTWWD